MYLGSRYHRTHKNDRITFTDHLYLSAIYLDESKNRCVMKSTQSGLSEYLIALAMSRAGLLSRSVFYVLPTHPLKTRFVTNRWDQSVLYTPMYQAMQAASLEKSVGPKKAYGGESMSLKMVGDGVVAFVSSQSRASFTEFPADDVIVDELDECVQANIEMADERLSHSKNPKRLYVANPTIEGWGVDERFSYSDQKEWHVPCPHCGKWQELDYFENVVRQVDKDTFVLRDEEFEWDSDRDVHVLCAKCGKPMDRWARGEWIATARGDYSGYHISKMFSGSVSVRDLVRRHDRGLANEEVLTRFYNGDLGVPFTAAGAKITRDILRGAVGEFQRGAPESGRCVLGADVGSLIHVVIGQLFERPGDTAGIRLVFIGTVDDEDELLDLYAQYRCVAGVIDALPEQRLARKVVAKRRGMFRCFYGEVKNDQIDERRKTLTVYRTSALDAVKEGLVVGSLMLPRDAESVTGFYDHMTAATRVKETRADGSERFVWREGSAPDHYHHACAYAMQARRLVLVSR